MSVWQRDSSGRLLRATPPVYANRSRVLPDTTPILIDFEMAHLMGNDENREGGNNMQPPQPQVPAPPQRTMRDYLNPPRQTPNSCIILPPDQNAFHLKSGIMQLIIPFHGMDSENPYTHLKAFEEVCNMCFDNTCSI